jgi:hypothetical protein
MAVLFVASLSNAAMADWKYTKWDMTVEEVQAASQNRLSPLSEDQQARTRDFMSDGRSAAMLAGWVDYENRQYLALFYFDGESKRLVAVNLNLKSIFEADDLLAELTGKYGAPTEKTELSTDFYSRAWKKDGDRILFLRTPGTAKLNFFPD